MDLRKAMEVVIRDLLNNNEGEIGYDDINNATSEKLDKLAKNFIESDEFLTRFNNVGEQLINGFIDDFGDEYNISE